MVTGKIDPKAQYHLSWGLVWSMYAPHLLPTPLLRYSPKIKLELELTQTQMAQKPVTRAEVYARALRASLNLERAEVRFSQDSALISDILYYTARLHRTTLDR